MLLAAMLWAAVTGGESRAEAVRPATVEGATKVLDLTKFPVMDGATVGVPRRLASLGYTAKGDPRKAYAFQKKTLEGRGWKELKGGYLSDMSCSGAFGKAGFVLSVMTSPGYGPGSAGMVQVQLVNLGNIDLKSLPVPKDAKLLYAFPASLSYGTETPAEETAQALRKLLTGAGWQPYGNAGDTQFFKQNAVRLSVTTAAAPAQGGKTMIQLSSELMSADLPAPAETLSTAYSDSTKALALDVDMTSEQLANSYREVLGKAGWKPTTERLIQDDHEDTLIFNNGAKDILTLTMRPVDGKLRAVLDHKTAAEFAEIVRLAKAAEDRRKADADRYAKLAADEAARDRPIASIEIPKEAKKVQRSKDEVKFTLAAGKGKDAASSYRIDLRNQGWTEESSTLEAPAGTVVLRKKSALLTVLYVDAGVDAAQVTITAIDADIEAVDAK